MIMAGILQRLAKDRRASMAIETAIVAPVLIMMTLGVVEVGTVVARQHELQSVANESEIIILAAAQGAETDLATIKAIVRESVSLSASEVMVSRSYRCSADANTVTNIAECDEEEPISSYVVLDISEDYVPTWTFLGIGQPITFSVERRVQVS